MSKNVAKAARVPGVSLGTALTATTATAAPHPPHVERISTAADGTQADGPSDGAAISADGRHVAFPSTAPDFGCAPFFPCLLPNADGSRIAFSKGTRFTAPYLYDLDTGATTGVRGTQPSLSGNGTALAYTSGRSVHHLELATGKRQLISVDRWVGRNDLPAGHPSVNADGTVVAFASASPDLVEADTNGVSDVFLRTVQ